VPRDRNSRGAPTPYRAGAPGLRTPAAPAPHAAMAWGAEEGRKEGGGVRCPRRGPVPTPAPHLAPVASREEKTIHFNAVGAAAVLRRLLLRIRGRWLPPRLARRLRGLPVRAVVACRRDHFGLVGVCHPAATGFASAAGAEGLRARQWRRPGKR
jgi:hypothetical protein